MRIKFYRTLALAILIVLPACTPSGADEPQRRVLIIGIDGCRLDAMQIATTPNLDSLVLSGVKFVGTDIREPNATDKADTTSGPGWSNLLTGVWPDKHHVLDNGFAEPNYKRYPHVFARIKESRPDAVTASFTTWAPIADKIVSAADFSRNFSDQPTDYSRWDKEATLACSEYLRTADPDLVVYYQGQVDEAGHAHGFHPTVTAYTKAIETVDQNIGTLVSAIQSRPDFANEDWLMIVCTDHGGQGTDHSGGHSDPEVRSTFLIVSGKKVGGRPDVKTWQVDVVATALTHLKIDLKPEWELDGHAVGLK